MILMILTEKKEGYGLNFYKMMPTRTYIFRLIIFSLYFLYFLYVENLQIYSINFCKNR